MNRRCWEQIWVLLFPKHHCRVVRFSEVQEHSCRGYLRKIDYLGNIYRPAWTSKDSSIATILVEAPEHTSVATLVEISGATTYGIATWRTNTLRAHTVQQPLKSKILVLDHAKTAWKLIKFRTLQHPGYRLPWAPYADIVEDCCMGFIWPLHSYKKESCPIILPPVSTIWKSMWWIYTPRRNRASELLQSSLQNS